MNNRLKELRSFLDMSLEDFGSTLGVTRATVSRWENGERGISNQAILSICREFNVNEDWLRTGQGEMFQAKNTSLLDQLSQEFGLGLYGQQLLATYLQLSEADKRAVERFVSQLTRNVQAAEEQLEANAAAPDEPKEKRFDA